MVAILRILSTIHKVIDSVEEGKEFHVEQRIGSTTFSIAVKEVGKVDEFDLILNKVDAGKLSGFIIDALLEAFRGTPITQDIGISLPSKADIPQYLHVAIEVKL
jgi:hypothetical protein